VQTAGFRFCVYASLVGQNLVCSGKCEILTIAWLKSRDTSKTVQGLCISCSSFL